MVVSVHSFTPVFKGFERPWQSACCGTATARIAAPLIEALAARGDLVRRRQRALFGARRRRATPSSTMPSATACRDARSRSARTSIDDRSTAPAHWAGIAGRGARGRSSRDPALRNRAFRDPCVPHARPHLHHRHRGGVPAGRPRDPRPRRRAAAGDAGRVRARASAGQVSPEFLRSQIEVADPRLPQRRRGARRARAPAPHRRPRSPARTASRRSRRRPIPSPSWRPPEAHRPRALPACWRATCRRVGRRLLICGLHVHVGIEDDELRIDLMNQVALLPAAPAGALDLVAVLARRGHRSQELPPRGVQRAAAHRPARAFRELRRVSSATSSG